MVHIFLKKCTNSLSYSVAKVGTDDIPRVDAVTAGFPPSSFFNEPAVVSINRGTVSSLIVQKLWTVRVMSTSHASNSLAISWVWYPKINITDMTV